MRGSGGSSRAGRAFGGEAPGRLVQVTPGCPDRKWTKAKVHAPAPPAGEGACTPRPVTAVGIHPGTSSCTDAWNLYRRLHDGSTRSWAMVSEARVVPVPVGSCGPGKRVFPQWDTVFVRPEIAADRYGPGARCCRIAIARTRHPVFPGRCGVRARRRVMDDPEVREMVWVEGEERCRPGEPAGCGWRAAARRPSPVPGDRSPCDQSARLKLNSLTIPEASRA